MHRWPDMTVESSITGPWAFVLLPTQIPRCLFHEFFQPMKRTTQAHPAIQKYQTMEEMLDALTQ
jgi:hypothetical protein